jgi:hypothetical protein
MHNMVFAGAILALIALLLLTAFLLPRNYTVEVSRNMRHSFQDVYDYVRHLENQVKYSEWLNADSDLRYTIVGLDGSVGAVLKWESIQADKKKNAGSGEQEIKKMTADTIETELRLFKPMPATCKLMHRFQSISAQQTKYSCTFHAHAPFPVNLPALLIGRRFIVKNQRKTLENIELMLHKNVQRHTRSDFFQASGSE